MRRTCLEADRDLIIDFCGYRDTRSGDMLHERSRGHLAWAKGSLRARRQAGDHQSAGLFSVRRDGSGHRLQSRWLGGQPMDGLCRVPKTAALYVKRGTVRFNATRWVLQHGGSVPIDRADPSPSSIKTAVDILQRGEIILIFPSGTRSAENIAFKRGAATVALHARVPLVPAFFQGPKHMQVAHLLHRPLDPGDIRVTDPNGGVADWEGDDD